MRANRVTLPYRLPFCCACGRCHLKRNKQGANKSVPVVWFLKSVTGELPLMRNGDDLGSRRHLGEAVIKTIARHRPRPLSYRQDRNSLRAVPQFSRGRHSEYISRQLLHDLADLCWIDRVNTNEAAALPLERLEAEPILARAEVKQADIRRRPPLAGGSKSSLVASSKRFDTSSAGPAISSSVMSRPYASPSNATMHSLSKALHLMPVTSFP
jgi:hypothetical protein